MGSGGQSSSGFRTQIVHGLYQPVVYTDIPIPANHLINSQAKDQDGDSNVKIVECPVCFEQFEHRIRKTKGSPLNFAFVGHFDGWQPFGSSYRGFGSFEVSVANMKKAERNHVEEVYLVGLVPCSQVPNLPNGLDPVLQPLMNDLCEGFIEGYK